MAMTVSASVQLIDMMSAPIQHIVSALDIMCNTLDSVDTNVNTGFDSSVIDKMRQHIDTANAELAETAERIDKIHNKTDSVVSATRNVTSATDAWAGKIAQVGAGYLSLRAIMQGIEFAVGYSDSLTQNTNRLNLMNDGSQSTDVLQNDIYSAAMRSRSSVGDMTANVASLGQRAGDAFSSNAEIIRFAENLSKQFAIAGATQQEQASATLQLTQALGSGVLRGEELNAVFEAASPIIQNIADYLEVPIGKIREMASDGEITADIVKKAMLEATDEINADFDITRVTWEQNLTMLGNKAYMAFKPVGDKINEIANSEKLQETLANIGDSLGIIAESLVVIIDAVSGVAEFIADNWDLIAPILGTVIAIMAVYSAMMLVRNVIKICSAVSTAFSVVWSTCPVIAVIILIIGAFYLLIAIINRVTGKSISALGVITGTLNYLKQGFIYLGQDIANVFLGIWEVIQTIGRNIERAFEIYTSNIKKTFYGLGSAIMDIIGWIAEKLNMLPFVDFDYSGIMNKADEWAEKSAAEQGYNITYESLKDAYKIGTLKYDTRPLGWETEAYNDGYDFGANLFNFENEIPFGPQEELGIFSQNSFDNSFDNLMSGTDATAKNTKEIAENTEKANSLLELVRDNWEKEAIAKYTAETKTITYDLSGMQNTYNNTGEAFDFVKELQNYLNQKRVSSAEGI